MSQQSLDVVILLSVWVSTAVGLMFALNYAEKHPAKAPVIKGWITVIAVIIGVLTVYKCTVDKVPLQKPGGWSETGVN